MMRHSVTFYMGIMLLVVTTINIMRVAIVGHMAIQEQRRWEAFMIARHCAIASTAVEWAGTDANYHWRCDDGKVYSR